MIQNDGQDEVLSFFFVFFFSSVAVRCSAPVSPATSGNKLSLEKTTTIRVNFPGIIDTRVIID